MNPAGGEARLKQRIGFLGLLAMSVGINIGGALFALTTVAAGLAGPSLPLAMLLSAIPALLAVVPYAMFTSALPTTSGTYRYAQLLSPTLALVSMLTLAICIVIGGQPLYALAFGVYLNQVMAIDPRIGGLMVLTFFYLVNLLGVGLTARVQVLLFFVLVAALALFVILGIPRVEAARFAHPFPKGIGGTIAASGLLFTFCAGGFFVADLGGEVVEARRIFPGVLLLGMAIAVAGYLLILGVTVGVADTLSLKGQTLIQVAGRFMPRPALTFFIIGGALTACATTINIVYSVVARGLMVVAAEGLLPPFIGSVNRRFGTPHWGLTLAWAISAVSLVTIPSLMFFGSMLNLGLILAITVVAAAGLRFPDRFPQYFSNATLRLPTGWRKAACWGVIALNALIFAFFILAIGKASLLFAGILLAMLAYARSRSRILAQIGRDPEFLRKAASIHRNREIET